MKYLFKENTVDCQSAKYILCKNQIGKGSYSSVFECKNSITGRHYAAKKYSKKLMYGLEVMIRNEFEVLKSVSMTNSNILSLIDYFETDYSIYLVTDLAKGGDLFDRVVHHPRKRLSEVDAREITHSLVSAVAYLHSNSIVHRDIKAENLLFQTGDSNSILVADFGLARILHPYEKLYDVSGTLSYMAPEIFDRYPGYDYSVDIWAIGVALYFMLCGYFPFDCEDDEGTRNAIKNRLYLFYPPAYWTDISTEAKDFILSCFEMAPEKRPKAATLLQHPYLISTELKLSDSVEDLLSDTSRFSLYKDEIRRILAGTSTSSSDSFSTSKSSCSTLVERGRLESMKAGASSFGDLCLTPECVSAFTSPLISPALSRNNSVEDFLKV
ncbi:Calcium/calmodulin-dependent protein kinase type I [Spathaspora sp. JA1]|nr:Calcium/calmodulin-dependent protein kinase type I [Spathaspora sp. JA1]